jgi:hypothetical protein
VRQCAPCSLAAALVKMHRPCCYKHARTLALQLQAFSCSVRILSLLLCAPAGLWPDVGFAFKAAHMPGRLGLFLGLSGVRLSSPADLLYTGIATQYVPEDQLQVGKMHSLLAGNVLAVSRRSSCRKHQCPACSEAACAALAARV